MKQLFLSLAFIATTFLTAQTNTFTGAVDNYWNNASNWSLNLLPITAHNVIVPTGTTVILNTNTTIQSIQLTGTASLIIAGNLSISGVSNASAQSTITWGGGILGGGGTFNNLGHMTLVPGGKQIIGGTILNNSGTITEDTDWVLDIVDGTVNNLPTGIIDLKDSNTNIMGSGSGSHLLNNAGIIKKTGIGNSVITAELHNTGTISVESGIIQFNNPQSVLTGGIYNVASGGNLVWTSTLTVSGVLSGNIIGDLNWSGTLHVPVAAAFNFTGSGTFNWGNGHLTGGGSLTNSGILWMTSAYYGTKYIEDGTTFNNAGTIRITNDWSLDITDGTLNNLASGIIDIQFVQIQILGSGTGSHVLNNAGLIKKTIGIGTASILAELHNTGTISVEAGTIAFNNAQTQLNGGMYNVAYGCYLMTNTAVTCLGTLTGIVEGGLIWISDIIIPAATAFNFSGNGTINWGAGTIKGGGILTNLNTLDISSGWAGFKSISESTTITNPGTLRISTDTAINMNGGTINNLASGTIDLQGPGLIDSVSGTNTVNNIGLLKKSASTGTYRIAATVNNTGTIEANAGSLSFGSLNNTLTGTVTGIAAIQLPTGANLTNNGIFAPGGEPGILTVTSDYQSTVNTRLKVQLYGLSQGTQYDLLSIQGNAIIAGILDVDLQFDPNINDQFTIATTWGTLTSTLPTTAIAIFNGIAYTFSIATVDNNKLVLTLAQKVLATDSFDAIDKKIVLAPNPAKDIISLQNGNDIILTDAMIIDVNGRIIQKVALQNSVITDIRVDHLSPGCYFMKIDSSVGSFVKRFTVQ